MPKQDLPPNLKQGSGPLLLLVCLKLSCPLRLVWAFVVRFGPQTDHLQADRLSGFRPWSTLQYPHWQGRFDSLRKDCLYVSRRSVGILTSSFLCKGCHFSEVFQGLWVLWDHYYPQLLKKTLSSEVCDAVLFNRAVSSQFSHSV